MNLNRAFSSSKDTQDVPYNTGEQNPLLDSVPSETINGTPDLMLIGAWAFTIGSLVYTAQAFLALYADFSAINILFLVGTLFSLLGSFLFVLYSSVGERKSNLQFVRHLRQKSHDIPMDPSL